MPSFTTLWRPADAPDVAHAPELDLEGAAGALISGYQVGQSFKEARQVRSAERVANAKGASAASTLEFLNKYNIPVDPVKGVQMNDLRIPGGVVGGLAAAIAGGPAVKASRGDPMYDVHRKAAEQTLALNKLNLDEALDKRDDHLESKQALQGFGTFLSDAIKAGQATNPHVQASVLDWMSRNPAALNEPAFHDMIAEYKASRLIGEQAQAIKEATAALGKPTTQDIKTDTGVTHFGVDPLKQERLNLEKLGLLQKRQSAEQRGDSIAQRQLELQLKANEQGILIENMPAVGAMTPARALLDSTLNQLAPRGSGSVAAPQGAPPAVTAPSFNPQVDNPLYGNPTGAPQATPDALSPPTVAPATQPVIQAPAPPSPTGPTFKRIERPLTAGATRQFQEENVNADLALHQLEKTRSDLQKHPDAFGPVGVGKQYWEVVKGALNNKADATINKIREQAGITFVNLAKSLRNDTGNMSHWEQSKLAELGDLRTVSSVPSVALAKADVIESMVVAKKLRLDKALSRVSSDNTLRLVAPEDLSGLYQSGFLSDNDVVRYGNMMPKAVIDKLKQK